MNLFNVYPRFDITLAKAEGVYVYDDNNQSYLDLYGGHGVISIGHSHPNYVNAITNQISAIGFYSNSVNMPIQDEFAQLLKNESGYENHQVFICNSGAEANENALKLASFHTKKKKIIAFKGSFHGRTAAALNVTDNAKLSAPINENNFDVCFVELNNKKQLDDAFISKDVAAVIIEGIQGVGGLDSATDEYFQYLSKACKSNEALLILDEIQSGYMRSGKFFAHQHSGIEADIITMAKGMGNGFPIGGLLIHQKIKPFASMLGTTFGGNHLACAAGLAVLNTLKEEQITNNVNQISTYLIAQLRLIPAIKNIKGRGLMLGLEFNFPITELRSTLLMKHHIFTGASANPNLLRILPPLNIQKQELAPFINALKAELTQE